MTTSWSQLSTKVLNGILCFAFIGIKIKDWCDLFVSLTVNLSDSLRLEYSRLGQGWLEYCVVFKFVCSYVHLKFSFLHTKYMKPLHSPKRLFIAAETFQKVTTGWNIESWSLGTQSKILKLNIFILKVDLSILY